MKRRSKYSTSGPGRDGKKRDPSPQPHDAVGAPPFAGKPLDGSQYVDVVEEQRYAEQRPTPEEQQPTHDMPKR